MRARFGNWSPSIRRTVAGVGAALLAFIGLAAWAFASPVGASPDDDYHLVSIWCGAGERDGLCETPRGDAPDGDTRMVPESLVVDSICFVFEPDVSAACQGDLDDRKLIETDRGNFEGDYPPIYYAVMSVFAGGNVEASVLTMRLVNAALFVGLISVLTWLTPAPRRQVVVMPVVVTAVPLGTFIVASINPSSWALLSAATLWIALYNYFETSGRRRWLFAGVAGLGLVIGAGARADAAAYAGLAILGVLILQARRTRRFALSAILPVAYIGIAIVFYRLAGQSSAATGGLDSTPSAGALLREFYQDLIMVPDLWVGMLGRWGLGWLDTAVPALVWVASCAVFAGVIFFGLGRGGVRKYLAVALMFVALWFIPTFLQVQSHAPVGSYIQPRYILPIAIMFAGFALVKSREPDLELSVAQIVVIVMALSGANAIALHANMRRYVTGMDEGGANLSSGAEWWWGAGPTPMVTWLIGSVAFALSLVLLGMLADRGPARAFDRLRAGAAITG